MARLTLSQMAPIAQSRIIREKERGRIVQAGQHEQLMREEGHYQRVAALQIPDDNTVRLLGVQHS